MVSCKKILCHKGFIITLIIVVLSVAAGIAFVATMDKKDEDIPVTLSIKNGNIQGSLHYSVRNDIRFYAFRGIPYAEPPLGNLRFSAPVPKTNWTDTLDATKDKDGCTSFFKGTEDCLYINVYSPNITGSLPVMVWIYGGFFEMGDSTYNKFSPDYFVEDEVVFVSFNYRLGIFGFYTMEDEVAPGNSGLKDQILALKWVQDNIESFGGNPKNVTVFGQSAGSVSISYLLQAPQLTEGLFHRAIMQSGTSLNLWGFSRNKKESILDVAKILNITETDSKTITNKLREVNSTRLELVYISTEATIALGNPLSTLTFSPTQEPDLDGAVITEKSYGLLNSGKFNKVPCIIGFNSEESLMFKKEIKLLEVYFESYVLDHSRIVPIDMNINTTENAKISKNVGTEILKKYFGLNPFIPVVVAPDSKYFRFLSEDQFERPINKAVELMSNYTDVYYYKFSYFEDKNSTGASHTDELKWLFARRSINNVRLSKKIVKLWTNFAKYSNPTPEKDESLDSIVWTPYSKNSQNYIEFAVDEKGSDKLIIKDTNSQPISPNLPFWDNLYSTYGKPPFDTY